MDKLKMKELLESFKGMGKEEMTQRMKEMTDKEAKLFWEVLDEDSEALLKSTRELLDLASKEALRK